MSSLWNAMVNPIKHVTVKVSIEFILVAQQFWGVHRKDILPIIFLKLKLLFEGISVVPGGGK